ncbi:putative triacylglycerol lipase protein [Neofusicoccum parvum UCRNP2]|uniref:Putative triacylglycerol lipase protein n=1 Tax=Botryosphaeria parva (strain UCR-NP2) TaxID=1287680 RepID=R1GP52_BOTPV|nr:putative triacylglycerol lipase protein [Neofusicoccum parvum UCRNP2]
MSAQNSAGIQTLLDAEREAQKIVQKDRTKRVKDARSEAQKEIEEYRQKKEEEFKAFEKEHSSGNKKAEEEADKATDVKLKEIKEIGKKSGNKVIEDLLKAVTDTIGLVSRELRISYRAIHSSAVTRAADPRLNDLDLGKEIRDEYAAIREHYDKPLITTPPLSYLQKHPIILAHGLLGFDEIRIGGPYLPGIEYWRGIKDALEAKDIECPDFMMRSENQGADMIECRHSMGCVFPCLVGKWLDRADRPCRGLDSRYMISQLKPPKVDVKSLTTIASPHRGSAFADFLMDQIGPNNLPKAYKTLEFFGLETGAFSQLTRNYMQNEFNPKTPDLEGVKYYSYGATLEPTRWSVFKPSHDIVKELEGAPNDGLRPEQ